MVTGVYLGVTGFKGSGKSEVRNYLTRSYGFTAISMADPIKNMLKALGLTDAQLWGDQKEVRAPQLLGVTPRLAMQTLGTEWGRLMIHPDLWVNQWRTFALECKTPVVADDVRFANEFAMIRGLGGKILRVTRLGNHMTEHASEQEMADLDADYTLANNSRSLVELHRSVDAALRVLRLKQAA